MVFKDKVHSAWVLSPHVRLSESVFVSMATSQDQDIYQHAHVEVMSPCHFFYLCHMYLLIFASVDLTHDGIALHVHYNELV